MNEQYAMMPDKILMDDTLAVTAKHIYLLLDVYYFQTQENDIITLSKAKISEVLNAELKTVTRHIDKLIQRKYIEQIKGTGIGRNNPSKYKLLSRPSKDNGIQFTKIGRNRIFSMPSEILIKYCWIKCLYRKNRGSTNIADYLLAAIESPYKLPGDFINDLELLKDYNFSYELKHKLTIEFSDGEADEQKEKAQSEDQAERKDENKTIKTGTINNIHGTEEKITAKIQKVKGFEEEMNTPGTAAYLVKKHADAFKIPLTPSYVRDSINKLQQLITEYTYLGVEKTINYMIDNDTKTLNFIKSVIPTVLAGFDPEYEAKNAAELKKWDRQGMIQSKVTEYKRLLNTDYPKDKLIAMKAELDELITEFRATYGR